MKSVGRQCVMMLVLLGATLTFASFASAGDTTKTTFGGVPGNCYATLGVTQCRTSWIDGQQLKVYLIDEFSDYAWYWYTAAENARQSWNSAPLAVSWSWSSGSTYMYLQDAPSSDTLGLLGVHRRCPDPNDPVHFQCTTAPLPMDIHWSEIKINRDALFHHASLAFATQWAFAHEIGHAFGLGHHANSSYLMYEYVGSVNGPVAGDFGSTPVCAGAYSTWGILCIYDWD